MGSHSRAGGHSHLCQVTTLLRLRLRRHLNVRFGQPNSSRLSPVHVWWFSHASRLRTATMASPNYQMSTNWDCKCGSLRNIVRRRTTRMRPFAPGGVAPAAVGGHGQTASPFGQNRLFLEVRRIPLRCTCVAVLFRAPGLQSV